MLLLDTWYLILDVWHRYLTCYYLIPDTWHLIFDTGTWYVITWHLIPDTWYMTSVNWHAITWYLTYVITWYWHTWSDIVTPDLIILHLTPILRCIFMTFILTRTWHGYYTATRHLVLLNSCIPCTHVPCIVTLINSTVIPTSGRACLVSEWRCCFPRSC